MSISYESSKLLAKLLASENISITFNISATTASFDVIQRILTLPYMTGLSNEVIDGFIIHEVGHARYTSQTNISKLCAREKLQFEILNTVEDIRIEKAMQQEYPGTVQMFNSFRAGLRAMDFFTIKENGIDVNRLGFVDRLNLHFKCATTTIINFSAAEIDIIRQLHGMRLSYDGFEDAVTMTKVIQDFLAAAEENKEDSKIVHSATADAEQATDTADTADAEQATDTADTGTSGNTGDSGAMQDEHPNNEISIISAYNNSIAGHIVSSRKRYYHSNVTIPKTSMAELISTGIIIPNSNWLPYVKGQIDNSKLSKHNAQLEREITPVVNKLVTQFNIKKSAHIYEKTRSASSGMLDMNKLVQSTYSDDIFLTCQLVPEEKNHGVIVLVDNSASMTAQRLKVAWRQALILAYFCTACDIPFSVYTFTENATLQGDHIFRGQNFKRNSFRDPVILMTEVFCSANTKTELQLQFNAVQPDGSNKYRNSLLGLCQSTTPLNDVLIKVMPTIIDDFSRRHMTEKLSLTVLADGASNYRSILRQGPCDLDKFNTLTTPTGRIFTYNNLISGMPATKLACKILKTSIHAPIVINMFLLDYFSQLLYASSINASNCPSIVKSIKAEGINALFATGTYPITDSVINSKDGAIDTLVCTSSRFINWKKRSVTAKYASARNKAARPASVFTSSLKRGAFYSAFATSFINQIA